MGYGTESTGSALYKGIGSFFFSLGANEEKIDLTSITLTIDDPEGFMDPTSDEYLRTLNPESAGNLECYTYVNKALGLAMGMEEADAEEMVGWYLWTAGYDWESAIPAKDKSKKIAKGAVLFDIHQAFLGQFGGGYDFKFVCNGQVIADTTEFETGSALYYMFHNWTPVNVNLTEIEVTIDDPEGFMDPTSDEYIRTLSPESAGNLECYTYVNKALGLAMGMEEADAEEMVGWYLWTPGYNWEEAIPSKDKTKKVGEKGGAVPDVVLTPGYSYLGQFGGGYSFHFKFPNPIR